MQISECRPEDLPALLDLYTHLNPDGVGCPVELAQANLEQIRCYTGSGILLGKHGDRLLASCTLFVLPNLTRGGQPYALIENVVTHADHRCQGHGTAILQAAAERAWAQGCYNVMLLTGTEKQSTLDFYVGAGFAQTKIGFQMRR